MHWRDFWWGEYCKFVKNSSECSPQHDQIFETFDKEFQEHFLRLLSFIKQQAISQKAPATSTNYSLRIIFPHKESGCEYRLITRTGFSKAAITPEDFLVYNGRGDLIWKWRESDRPSAETNIHHFLYQPHLFLPTQPACVLHFHSVLSSFLSWHYLKHHQSQIVFQGLELLKAFPGIIDHHVSVILPIVQNNQDMDILTKDMRELMQSMDLPIHGILIAGHGLYTWGKDVDEAIRHAEAWEYLLEFKHLEHLYRNVLIEHTDRTY
jgi:methylthioribulose-1-phosphate dehydratase